MLRAIVERYYIDDDLNEEQLHQIKKCWQNAEKVLLADTVRIYNETSWFHDWYVRELAVYCEKKKKHCRITLSKRSRNIVLLCSDIESISTVGELVSSSAQYPGAFVNDSFADVFAVWFDHHESISCYLLLDNGRYAIIRSANVELFEQ